MWFFPFHQQLFFIIPVLYQQIENRLCVYNKSNPYSTKHSQDKNELCLIFFSASVFQAPPPSPPLSPPPSPTCRPFRSDAAFCCPCRRTRVCLSRATACAEESSSLYDRARWGRAGLAARGGRCAVILAPADGRAAVKVTMVYSRYNGASIITHPRTAGSLLPLVLVHQIYSFKQYTFEAVFISSCNCTYI